jgi:hypothetical protein
MDWSLWSPIIISTIALLCSIISFWWIHWRTGHFVVSKPLSYMAVKLNNGGLVIEVPLSFYNTGTTPLAVEKLYLVVKYRSSEFQLFFNNNREYLGATKEISPTQFVVNGRESVMKIFGFQVRDKLINIDVGNWECELYGKINDNKYKILSKFTLYVRYFNDKAIPRLNLDDEYRQLVKRP